MPVSKNIFERVADVLKENQSVAYRDKPVSTKYFQVRDSTDKNEIGSEYPQTKRINLPIAHSLKFGELPETKLDFGKIRLHWRSKLSDLISTAAISAPAFILSEKAIEVFQKFNLGIHKIHSASVVHRFFSYKFGVLHFDNDLHEKLDFSASKFYVANILGGYEFDIDINTIEEYEEKRNEVKKGLFPETKRNWFVQLKEGVLLSDTIIPDLFIIKSSSTNTYVSKILAEAIMENGLTGFSIEKIYNLKD